MRPYKWHTAAAALFFLIIFTAVHIPAEAASDEPTSIVISHLDGGYLAETIDDETSNPSRVTALTIRGGEMEDSDYAFVRSRMRNLRRIDLGGTYAFDSELPESAFSGMTSLSTIVLPEGIEVIGKNAFYRCTSLRSITLPDDLVRIEEDAFRGSGLRSITFPYSLEEIGDSAFANCRDLTTVRLSDNYYVIRMGKSVFSGSDQLRVSVPDSIRREYQEASGWRQYLGAPSRSYISKFSTSVSPSDGGRIDGKPYSNVSEGRLVSMTARPARGFIFKHWVINGVGDYEIEDEKLSFDMPDGNVDVIAVFEWIGGPGISRSDRAIYRDDYDYDYNSNTVGNRSPSTGVNTRSEQIPNPGGYKLSLKVSPGAGGSVSGDYGSGIKAGEEVKLVATARSGYHFTGWQVRGFTFYGDLNYEKLVFDMPAADITVTAKFQKN